MDSEQLPAIRNSQSAIACPFCGSIDTEMIALFGMQMMTSQHYCRHCRSAFEAVKWDGKDTEMERGQTQTNAEG